MAAPQDVNIFGQPGSSTTLDGLFKRIYGDKLENVIPEFTQLQVDIPFKRAKKLGLIFEQPVVIGLEQGVTYAATGSGAFTIRAPVAGRIKNAQVTGSQHVLRAQVDYESLFSGEGTPEAFENTMGVVVRNMLESVRRRLEIDFLYGQDDNGIGVVSSLSTNTITVTTASWAPGIWAGMENAGCQIFAAGSPPTTARTGGTSNTVGTTAGVCFITAVDLDARTITFDGMAASVVATDVLFFLDQRTTSAWNVMIGLHKILTNTGTLFNISAASFSLWRGNVQSAGSLDLSFDVFLKGCAKTTAKGASGAMNVYVNPVGWANLMSDQAALRRFDKADGSTTYEIGAEQIKFHNQTGTLTIKSHPCVKEGFCYAIMPSLFKRVGATDVTFDNSRMEGVAGPANQFFRPLADNAGVEVRCYSHQALFTDAPGKSFAVNNIVNS